MLLLLSGEGPTDIGHADVGCSGLCGPRQWVPGPMSLLIDQLFEYKLGYSAIESDNAYFISSSELYKIAKQIKNRPEFRGKGQNHYHRRGTQALASAALALSEKNERVPVIAVYFRDCGGSNSSPSHLWEDIYNSMAERSGFQLLGLATGVPMIPKPISEAWLICALKINPYIDCQKLEESTGSPREAHPLKNCYNTLLSQHGGDVYTLIKPVNTSDRCVIDAERINMNSFNIFRRDFYKALEACRNEDWFTLNTYCKGLYRHCVDAASDILFSNLRHGTARRES
jgi:hypothetical protein